MLRRFSRFFIVSVLILSVTACVTHFKAAGDGTSGYRELKVSDRVYYVEYTESYRISWEQLNKFALRRAAELARKNGYKAFDVLDKVESDVFLKSDVDSIVVNSPGLNAWDPPVASSYKTDGRVEGKRVVYKIEFVNE